MPGPEKDKSMDMGAEDKPLIRRRSFSAGATRRATGLTVRSVYTVSPRRRLKRLVLGPGQSHPGSDHVHLVPEHAEGEDPSVYLQPSKGKKMTEGRHATAQSKRQEKPRKALVRRRPPKNTSEMLLHVDAECGFADTRAPSFTTNEQLQRLGGAHETQLVRQGEEPIGLTIDENLLVTNVVPGTPAAAAGLLPGVRLSTVNGQHVATQADAIGALRASGSEVAVGLLSDTTAPSMIHDKVVAGKATAFTASERRGRRADPKGVASSRPPFGTEEMGCDSATPADSVQSLPSESRRLQGVGQPGVGPLGPWLTGRDDGTVGGVPAPIICNDPFKPNLYTPHLPVGSVRRASMRSVSTPPALRRSTGVGNKTSYQLADARGELNEDGTWDISQTQEGKSGKSQAMNMKSAIENQNGDIITHSGAVTPRGAATPRRGKDRAASPVACRPPASGAPVGDQDTPKTGRRVAGDSFRSSIAFPIAGPDVQEHQHRSSRRSFTPGRSRNAPEGHGDIIGNTYGTTPLPSPRGLRKVPPQFKAELPKPEPRAAASTYRHQHFTPSPSDIFNLHPYGGGCRDTDDLHKSRVRGHSPRNASSIEFGRRPPQSPGASDRRGRGTGSLAPPQPHHGYAPWSERE